MRIRLNVATRPLESHRRFVVGSVAAGALGLAALVALSASVASTLRRNSGERAEIAAYEAQLAQMRVERRALAAFFNAGQTITVMDRAAFLNSLIDQRSFPWTGIFTDLEKVLPAGVRVLSIAPKMESGKLDVKLTVGADSEKSKLAFLDQLEKSRAFSDVRLSTETPKTGASGEDQVELVLEALYSPASGAGP